MEEEVVLKNNIICIFFDYTPKMVTLKRKFVNLSITYGRVQIRNKEELTQFVNSVRLNALELSDSEGEEKKKKNLQDHQSIQSISCCENL